MPPTNRQWILARRPDGALRCEDLLYREQKMDAKPLRAGEILVRNRVFQCAPTIRNWMRGDASGFALTIPIGTAIRGQATAEVIASADERYPVGSRVSMIGSWQDFEVLRPAAVPSLRKLPDGMAFADALGRYGLNSLTAYFGMLDVGKPMAGETVLVSGAAGSVGAVAAQIALLKGCRVIGTAGSAAKCSWLVDGLGLERAINYRTEDLSQALCAKAPDGIDLFFDNVGGAVLEAAIAQMNRRGRIVLCGQISGYNAAGGAFASLDMMRLIYGGIRMQGFVMSDYLTGIDEAVDDLKSWEDDGRLQFRVDMRHGFENLPQIFNSLFTGENEGTLLVAI